MDLNCTNYIYWFWLKVLTCPFLCPILGFLRIWNVHPKWGEWTFECVYSFPEMWHQACCHMEPPVVNELYLLCQWCSQASGFNKSIAVSQFAIEAFWHSAIKLVVGNGKMMDTLNEMEQGLHRLCKILITRSLGFCLFETRFFLPMIWELPELWWVN